MGDMGIRELRTLHILGRTRSITAVAQEVHRTPAAVYKQLQVLADELGGPLYHRVGQRLRLTELGSLVLKLSEPLLIQYEDVLFNIDAWKKEKKSIVRIGTGPAASTYLIEPLLRRCHPDLPHVVFQVESGFTSSLLHDLRTGVLDLALVSYSPQDERTFSVEVVWDEEFVLVHKMPSLPRRCALQELGKFPFILFREGSRAQKAIDRYLSEMNLHPLVSMRFDNSETIKNVVHRGLGLSMLPWWSVAEDLRKGTLSTVHLTNTPFFFQLALLRRESNILSPSVEKFLTVTRAFKWKGLHIARHNGDHSEPEAACHRVSKVLTDVQ